MPITTTNARTLPCTLLQRCEYYDYDTRNDGRPAYLYGDSDQQVVNFWPEVERRGEDHVFSCAGIYPTGYNADGSARYDGELCTFGSEEPNGNCSPSVRARLV